MTKIEKDTDLLLNALKNIGESVRVLGITGNSINDIQIQVAGIRNIEQVPGKVKVSDRPCADYPIMLSKMICGNVEYLCLLTQEEYEDFCLQTGKEYEDA